jgi:hypothetical protein
MFRQIQLHIESLGARWCNLMHGAVRWPIHGQYECATCGRSYSVPWHRLWNPR